MFRLNQELGMTILISSHILGELARVATHYGVIREGTMVKQMSAVELEKTCRNYLYVKVGSAQDAALLLRQTFQPDQCSAR